MKPLFRLTRRTPKPGPKHAGPHALARPLTVAGLDDIAREAGLDPSPLREKLAEVAPLPDEPTTAEVLTRVIDGLRAIPVSDEPQQDEAPARPGAYLSNIIPGGAAGPYEALAGMPWFAGVRRLADGTPQAGLYLGDEDEDGQLVLDVTDVAWLGRFIDAAEEARDALYDLHDATRDEAAEASDAA